MAISPYSAILAIVETYDFSRGDLNNLVHTVAGFVHGRFSDLSVKIGVARVTGNRLRFMGVGGVSVVVKPPDRQAFLTVMEGDAIMVGQASIPEYFDFEMKPDTVFIVSANVPEDMCALLDCFLDWEDRVEELRTTAGGVICHYEKTE